MVRFLYRNRRRTAMLLAAALLALLVFSSAFLLAEARHDCSGSECTVCALVRTAVGRFTAVGGASFAAAALCFAALLFALPPAALPRPAFSFSLISDKVRLNN